MQRSNNEGEYKSNDFDDLLEKNEIKHETNVPKTTEQNEVAERMNRPLVETTRSILSDSGLPKRLWVEAFQQLFFFTTEAPILVYKTKHHIRHGLVINPT